MLNDDEYPTSLWRGFVLCSRKAEVVFHAEIEELNFWNMGIEDSEDISVLTLISYPSRR